MAFIFKGVSREGTRQVLKAAGAETGSTTHGTLSTSGQDPVHIDIDVSAASGTAPTLTLVVEGSVDNGASWFELGRIGSNGYRVGSVGTAPSEFGGAGVVHGVFSSAPMVRTRSVIGGTAPSFTYSVAASAG